MTTIHINEKRIVKTEWKIDLPFYGADYLHPYALRVTAEDDHLILVKIESPYDDGHFNFTHHQIASRRSDGSFVLHYPEDIFRAHEHSLTDGEAKHYFEKKIRAALPFFEGLSHD